MYGENFAEFVLGETRSEKRELKCFYEKLLDNYKKESG